MALPKKGKSELGEGQGRKEGVTIPVIQKMKDPSFRSLKEGEARLWLSALNQSV